MSGFLGGKVAKRKHLFCKQTISQQCQQAATYVMHKDAVP